MDMDFSAAINEIMPLVKDGDASKPFIITRDSAYGDWAVCYPALDKADGFTVSQREHDPYVAKYFGADFDGGSMPYVYNKVLCDRLRLEYYECNSDELFSSTPDKERIRALINFFEDNIYSFSQKVTDYLIELEQPFRELNKLCPFNMATGHEGWTFNENLAADAIDHIENAVESRVNTREDKPETEKQAHDGYTDLNKVSINDSEITISENPDAEYRYMVVENRYTEYYINSGDNNVYTGHTNDYLEAIDEFTKKVQYNIDCVKSTREVHKNLHGVEPIMLTTADCLPDSHTQNFTGKLIIVKAEELKPEYRTAESQLVICSHGNGARPNAIGTSVFGKELFSDKTVCYGRHQIAGIADPDRLPHWAAKKLSQMEAIKEPGVFEYGSYHFKPYRQFRKGEVTRRLEGDSRPWKTDAAYAMRNMSSDFGLGLSTYDWKKDGTDYSHKGFYAASENSDADIFMCIENGKLYVPHENELFQYKEPPQKEKAAQKPTQTPQSKQPPSLLGEVREAAQLVEQRKTERGNTPATKKKDGLEV